LDPAPLAALMTELATAQAAYSASSSERTRLKTLKGPDGLAPEQVELLVTLPIETMVNGLGDMESLRSVSIGGPSVITVVFKEGTDVFRARQRLGEQLAEIAGEMPTNVKMPRMTPLTSSTMDLLKIGLVEVGRAGAATR
jgi:Cu/Ag efflux pump CusA